MTNESYYRCLNSEDEIERWDNQQYTSTVGEPPDDWYAVWEKTHSKDPKDYSLVCERNGYDNGRYFTIRTKRAIEQFILCCEKYGLSDTWSPNDLAIVGEIDGVCAFDTPKEALKYGNQARGFVVFKGELVCSVSEYQQGGVCVRVIEPVTKVMNRSEFIEYIDNMV